MKQPTYLTAKEAARLLDVQVPTLYAYVSRGLIRSEETEGKSRARRYLAADVEALRTRKELRRDPAKVAESALHFGVPVLESAITLIEDGRFYYRGHDAIALARERPFAAVVSLIWTGSLAADWLDDAAYSDPPAVGVKGLAPIEAFQAVLPLAAAQDWAAYDLSPSAVGQTGARILNLLTAVFTNQPANSQASPHSIPDHLQQALAPQQPQAAGLFNTALILCADHELNISSFTARCVASAGSTPYGVVAAGLAALQGPKHGGFTERVAALLREADTPERAAATLASRLRRGEGIPGFGHPLYPNGDPRARELLDQVTAVCGACPVVLLAQELETAVWQTVGLRPTVDFGLVVLARALDLPPGAALGLFALGRTVGWIGHALEQYQLDQMIRPRARYVGPAPERLEEA
ncbi:MAG: citrate synthase family protein [Anaerolineales bacterium]|nr:citrate synthase family protein [Anaerolineales bacterium]